MTRHGRRGIDDGRGDEPWRARDPRRALGTSDPNDDSWDHTGPPWELPGWDEEASLPGGHPSGPLAAAVSDLPAGHPSGPLPPVSSGPLPRVWSGSLPPGALPTAASAPSRVPPASRPPASSGPLPRISGGPQSGPLPRVPSHASGPLPRVPGHASGPLPRVSGGPQSGPLPRVSGGPQSGPLPRVPGHASGPLPRVPGHASGPLPAVPGDQLAPLPTDDADWRPGPPGEAPPPGGDPLSGYPYPGQDPDGPRYRGRHGQGEDGYPQAGYPGSGYPGGRHQGGPGGYPDEPGPGYSGGGQDGYPGYPDGPQDGGPATGYPGAGTGYGEVPAYPGYDDDGYQGGSDYPGDGYPAAQGYQDGYPGTGEYPAPAAGYPGDGYGGQGPAEAYVAQDDYPGYPPEDPGYPAGYAPEDDYPGYGQAPGGTGLRDEDPGAGYAPPRDWYGDSGDEQPWREDGDYADGFLPGSGIGTRGREAPPGAGRPPSGGRGGPPRKRKSAMRRAAPWIALTVLLLVLGVGGGGYYYVYSTYLHPPDFSGDGTGSVQIVIKPGDTATAVGQKLFALGVVASARAFSNAAKDSTQGKALEPGTYLMHKHMSAASAFALLLKPATRVQTKVTIPEGLRLSNIIAVVGKATGDLAGYKQAIQQTTKLGLPSIAHGDPQGYLFPATYSIQPGTAPLKVLQNMVQAFDSEAVKVNLRAQAAAGLIKESDVITVASLVQAEGGKVTDFPKIARVIYNRLNQNMPLQLDSTVLFALHRYGVVASSAQTKANSPYNTYLHTGLPPGPIDSPGDAAIKAALHPAHGTWTYFVTVNPKTKETKFTSSYSEFLQFKAELEHNLAKGG